MGQFRRGKLVQTRRAHLRIECLQASWQLQKVFHIKGIVIILFKIKTLHSLVMINMWKTGQKRNNNNIKNHT